MKLKMLLAAILVTAALLIPLCFLVQQSRGRELLYIITTEPRVTALQKARTLIEKGANVNLHNAQGETPLMAAVRTGQPQIVALLEAAGAHQDLRTELFVACLLGRDAAVKRLLAQGLDPDSTGAYRCTPLAAAAFMGHVSVVRQLLSRGAVVNFQDTANHTPLDFAGENPDAAQTRNAVRVLKSAGAKHGSEL